MHPDSPKCKKNGLTARTYLILLLALGLLVFPGLFLYTACTLQIGFESPQSPDHRLTATIQHISTENAKLISLLSTIQVSNESIPVPTATAEQFFPVPSPSPPVFRNLFYSINPDGNPKQSFFPAGTERIYAFWDYANLKDGTVVRRVWSQEGRLLFVRQEEWDTVVYGTDGRMEGVSIYNEEIGFPTGRYSLTLFIDGIEQAEIDINQRTFWLVDPRVDSPVESPDGMQKALIQAAGRLFLQDISGEIRLLSIFQEISHLSWFPDSRHLLVSERDRTYQSSISDDSGITHKLWIIETLTGESHLIGAAGENFHSPSISPRGEFIALLSGPTIQEACRASPTLVILKLDEAYRRQTLYQVHDFSGFAIEDPPRYGVYPRVSLETFDWTDLDLLDVELWWSCPAPGQTPPDGIYKFNMSMMSVELE
jgi:hypothetical protein